MGPGGKRRYGSQRRPARCPPPKLTEASVARSLMGLNRNSTDVKIYKQPFIDPESHTLFFRDFLYII